MPKCSPAFQFYPNDWLSSFHIQLMTPAEEGAYIRLLAYAWQAEDCGLPDDDDQLAVLSRLNQEWFKGSSTKVRSCFFTRNKRLYNKRLLEERKKQEEWREKCRSAGIESGKSRRLKDKSHELTLNGSCDLVRTKSELNTNTSSSSSSSSSNINKKTSRPLSLLPTQEQKERLAELTVKVQKAFNSSFNPWMWIKKRIDLHPEIHILVLESMSTGKDAEGQPIKTPWAWAEHIALIEGQNWNEKQSIKEHESLKNSDGIKWRTNERLP